MSIEVSAWSGLLPPDLDLLDALLDGRLDGEGDLDLVDALLDGRLDGLLDGRLDGLLDGLLDGRLDGDLDLDLLDVLLDGLLDARLSPLSSVPTGAAISSEVSMAVATRADNSCSPSHFFITQKSHYVSILKVGH